MGRLRKEYFKITRKRLYRNERREEMFKLESEYMPKGDQPKAIEKLVDGLNKKEKFQTLLGVTGSRKNIYNSKCNRKNTKTDVSFSA